MSKEIAEKIITDCERMNHAFYTSDSLVLAENYLALEAENERLLDECKLACDRHYRNGFNSGWNAGQRGDESLLKHVNGERLTSDKEGEI